MRVIDANGIGFSLRDEIQPFIEESVCGVNG
jgi:hypothetical protein